LAFVPVPSAKLLPSILPASVVTLPPGYVTTRIMLLDVSATAMRVLAEFTATPHGALNVALDPAPSADP
jgi:hypothetical protein